ncbi:MAG: SH3 domain-containing protein, partial [Anaerolineae bacterium]|nr:SH3 domain-containing protein [Anaerolineae bacterium]
YTYRSMLDARLTGAELAPLSGPIDTPTAIPTTVPETTPEATIEGGAAAEATAELAATDEQAASPTPEGARPTNTLPPTATTQPSNTPAPTATPTDTPTPTFTPSITPTFEPGVTVRGVIDSDQSVNVREGPGRTFAPIAALTPGAIVQITGRNGDGTWLKVMLDDGTEGWVSASLVAVEEPPLATEEATQTGLNINLDNQMVGLISDVNFYVLQETTPEPESTVEAEPEATEAIVEPTTVPTVEVPGVPAGTAATPYRDERWYGMTLGLVAIILVITIGMIVNILRGLFRRGK